MHQTELVPVFVAVGFHALMLHERDVVLILEDQVSDLYKATESEHDRILEDSGGVGCLFHVGYFMSRIGTFY